MERIQGTHEMDDAHPGAFPEKKETSPPLPAILRPATPSDHAFIVDSWLLSYRNQALARDAGQAYVHDMKWLIRRLIDRSAVLVAADRDTPGAIWGWAATHGTTVLYVYVRQEFRRRGIARMLLRPFLERPTTYTARTHHHVTVPPQWRYSFFDAIRIACEEKE